jgi:hypothetical protein
MSESIYEKEQKVTAINMIEDYPRFGIAVSNFHASCWSWLIYQTLNYPHDMESIERIKITDSVV